jgi:hypothetical protein
VPATAARLHAPKHLAPYKADFTAAGCAGPGRQRPRGTQRANACCSLSLPAGPRARGARLGAHAGGRSRAGEYFALESHLVTVINQTDVPTCPKAGGCKAVFGAFYRIDALQRNNSFLAQLMPYVNQSAPVRARALRSPGCMNQPLSL